MPLAAYRLPSTIFRYVLAISWPHQVALVVLTVITFLLEVAPLEIQRRVVNNLVKDRPERLSRLGRRKCDAGSAPTRPCLFEDGSIPDAGTAGRRRRSRDDRRGSRADWRVCRQQHLRAV